MNTEEPANNISRHRDELLRLACDERDAAQASPNLSKLLSDDPKLWAEFEETGELVRELRDALRPQPLPETLLRRIHTRLDERTGAGVRTAAPLPADRTGGGGGIGVGGNWAADSVAHPAQSTDAAGAVRRRRRRYCRGVGDVPVGRAPGLLDRAGLGRAD